MPILGDQDKLIYIKRKKEVGSKVKFVSFVYKGIESYGYTDSTLTKVVDLPKANAAYKQGTVLPATLIEAIKRGDEFLGIASQIKTWVDNNHDLNGLIIDSENEEFKLLAPIPRPTKNIFCVGKNYREHAIEMGSAKDIPEDIIVFSKTPTTVIGHQEKIESHHTITSALDYEGELAVVIGKKGKRISVEEADDYIFGYTVLNDITARDLQTKHKQYLLGKSLDSSCPMGPILITKDEINTPHDLMITTKVNGETRQMCNTSKMIFSIPTIISVISQGITLEPGDIIATGTPEGVGKGFKPPKYLRVGDQVEITIDQIGTLKNVVIE